MQHQISAIVSSYKIFIRFAIVVADRGRTQGTNIGLLFMDSGESQ